MKKSILTLTWIFATAFAFNGTFAQEEKAVAIGGAEISFDKETHDYGKIEQHANGECVFTFTNNGTEPLTISNAKGSCGCTVPVWPKEPIAPGASNVIKVKYDTKRIGAFNKSVTSTSNAVTNPTQVIRIKGKTLAVDGTSTTPVKKPTGSSPIAKPNK